MHNFLMSYLDEHIKQSPSSKLTDDEVLRLSAELDENSTRDKLIGGLLGGAGGAGLGYLLGKAPAWGKFKDMDRLAKIYGTTLGGGAGAVIGAGLGSVLNRLRNVKRLEKRYGADVPLRDIIFKDDRATMAALANEDPAMIAAQRKLTRRGRTNDLAKVVRFNMNLN